MSKPIKFTEHCSLSKSGNENSEFADALGKLIELEKSDSIKFEGQPNGDNKVPKYLGIESSGESFIVGYNIGATWLKENEISAVVMPKMGNIDYLEMFSAALEINSKDESDYFSNYFGIEFGKPEIQVDENFNIITPLILIHYISLLKTVTKRGLKKGYIYREENLQSKVKGHLLFQRHLQKNVTTKREDRAFCAFQDYTADIPENRLLKKALVFADRAINTIGSLRNHRIYASLKLSINQLFSLFSTVSDEIEIHEIKTLKMNKLFAGYKEAVELARLILRRFDYSLQNAETEEKATLPFWIDMPRLYEMYVYKWLKENVKDDEVLFQVKGYQGTAADYVLPKQGIILDAKYKPHYENGNAGIIDDIRAMSGYARDEDILHTFENPNAATVPCVILYPTANEDMKSIEEDETDKCKGFFGGENLAKIKKIRPYRDFYKMQVEVPVV